MSQPTETRPNIKAIKELYRNHCKEQGIRESNLWRYRYVIPLPIALMMAALIYLLYSVWNPFDYAYSSPVPPNEIFAGMSFLLSYIFLAAGLAFHISGIA